MSKPLNLDKMLHETLNLYFPGVEYFKTKNSRHQLSKLRCYENWLRDHLINECRIGIKKNLMKEYVEWN